MQTDEGTGSQQRVSAANVERFRAAQLVRPDLTFNAWVDYLFTRAMAARSADVPAPDRPPLQAADSGPPAGRRRGRPPGAAATPGLTGRDIRPHLFEVLLTDVRRGVPKGEVVQRIEHALGKRLNDDDRAVTTAGIERWRHRLLGDIAALRQRGIIEPESGTGLIGWRLTPTGVRHAEQATGKTRERAL